LPEQTTKAGFIEPMLLRTDALPEGANIHQPVDGVGYTLVKQLKDKHDQLDVDGHRRFLITVNDGFRAHARDVLAACPLIDFRLYPNFDRVYFEESPGQFFLVYHRDAFVSMEAGKLPTDAVLRSLVTQWVEESLSGNLPGALETALQISWDLRTIEWLSEGGQTLLELEAHLFLQKCTWKTPRALWELIRGPVPGIGDGRRQARRIRAA
jgi:hypothetical protein